MILESIRRHLVIWLNEDAVVKFLNPLTQDRRGTSGFESVGHGDKKRAVNEFWEVMKMSKDDSRKLHLESSRAHIYTHWPSLRLQYGRLSRERIHTKV
jgi:hypothetical protein